MSLLKLLAENFIDQPYMYHFTHVDNIDSILKEGLLVGHHKNNTAYKDKCEGISLTVKKHTNDVNLAHHLFEEYENSYLDDGTLDYPVIARIIIKSSELDERFIKADDDYKQLKKDDDPYESFIMGSICYVNDIKPSDIVKVEVEIDRHVYEEVKNEREIDKVFYK